MREIADGVYVQEHPIHFAGGCLNTRMTALVLDDGGVVLHSPVAISDELRAEIVRIGEVRALVAPSTCHHMFVADAQRAFPGVPTYAIAGLERKRPDLPLAPLPDELWADELERVAVGNRIMREWVLLHRKSHTVIAVDLVENIGDATPGVDRMMRTWIKLLGMWNKPRAAPELRWLTRDRKEARRALEHILSWDFDKMVIAHGELFERDAKAALRQAWKFVLGT